MKNYRPFVKWYITSNIEMAECFKVDQEDKKQAIQNAA